MQTIFKNDEYIKLYSQIQKRICLLEPNSDDESIDEIFQLLPSNFFDEKENLIMICRSFGMLGRYRRKIGRVVIKLFDRIMKHIKRDLQNESSILWNIFGGCFYYKFLMYQEGLINIDFIILCAQSDKTSKTAEYFLPEIIEYDIELFEKEIKFKYPCFSSLDSYSQENIQRIKILRNKHLKWLKESSDYFDEFYGEIEKDPLRLSIKKDDVYSFQKIISQTNLSINSVISESIIENFLRIHVDLHLIEYSVAYEAFDIFKFLLMNGAELNCNVIAYAIQSGNYDVIHIVESKMKEEFEKYALSYAIGSWNQEIIKYVIENYNFEFFNFEKNEKSDKCDMKKIQDDENDEEINEDIDNNNEDVILKIINNTFFSFNFWFFRKYLLPFFIKHPKFVENHIYQIILRSLEDISFYFTKNLIEYPGLDINYTSPDQRQSFLLVAVDYNNTIAVRHLLQNQKIDVNGEAFYSPLFYACANFADLKIIEMLINHPNINFNFHEPQFNDSILQISMIRGNAYAMKLLINTFPDIEIDNIYDDIEFCIKSNHLMTLKIFINYLKKQFNCTNFNQVIEYSKQFLVQNGDDGTFCNILINIINEINS